METIHVDVKNVLNTVSLDTINSLDAKAASAMEKLHNGTGAGNDFLGWLNLPSSTTAEVLDEIEQAAAVLRANCEYVVCIGIGGSYLGAKAVIEALSDSFAAYKPAKGPKVLFAGQNIGEDYLYELQSLLKDKKFGIIVISKSGTTTEPAIAFRILKEMLEKQAGKAEAAKLTIAITDAKKGALRTLATEEGYKTFVIPDNVGGRFSVLTPVGLLPIAVAGLDIKQLVAGAAAMETATATDDNIAITYAKTRNALYQAGKKIEILVNYNPKLHYVSEWWKQLYGESEGKEHKGIFPASVDNSTDLHSMGQWIQDGERSIFETVISVAKQQHETIIPTDDANLDGLNFLAGKHVDEVNKMAELGTTIAHVDGDVPNIHITIPALTEFWLGQLLYFFEKACGVSGYILGVNPFNQPGVEAYKRNMFALLDKPGYEAESKAIREKINK
ncbi:MAG: glucose-6-phosphate isomerase [Bacteroidales bacterium]|nr:glucose-6-phosphate isomerase [Bacteroidales bacterium]MDY2931736.1 glucose-6-phosphate isomerase [Muribaculaceae bacterium]MDD6851506.1 glucose-6-phosphate isomerase [Bacteroidales bacterium]MDD7404497.1 glucose-6-phosphate isomerase [Bacteroidales bacterium]MDY4880933.1 glucose-6-phosphate isomerase [Muribaculaceae bacterium]